MKVNVRLSHTENYNYDSKKNIFWNNVRVNSYNTRKKDTSDDQLEELFKSKFPYELSSIIRQQFVYINSKSETASLISDKYVVLSQMAFSVENIRYNSLDFDLIIEPGKKIMELFDNNFDFFEVFLAQYIPIAFNQTFSTDLGFNVGLEVNRWLIAPIEHETNKVNKTLNLSKANWLWILSNTSFVIPLILSILLFLYYLDRLENIQLINSKIINDIYEKQDRLIERYENRYDKSERLSKAIDSSRISN